MINGDFTGLPQASYYFTSDEGQLRKNVCVCLHTHTNSIYKHIYKIIYVYKIHVFIVYTKVTIY